VTETQPSWNTHCKKCEVVPNAEGDEIFVTFIKSPGMFIAGRVLVDARYTLKDSETNDFLVIFSSKGNEEIA
jgi:hypothetical protein